MYIKEVILENFRNIKSGMKVNKLHIDFSNRENKICLLVAPNGKGKTSLLSCLTPFSSLGNLDVRDSNQLIIEGKNGYKKLVIINGSDEIIIEHFYTATKDSHSVKSYFKLNDTELNPNGNVTSFKNVVYDILGIDMDYLKLIRIGDNVTNLIKLKATERKAFMSKMQDDVDIYLKYYTKISADVRDVKTIISHIVDKINKLAIDDIDQQRELIKQLEKSIGIVTKEIKEDTDRYSVLSYQLSEIGDIQQIKHYIDDLTHTYDDYTKLLKEYADISAEDITKELSTADSRVAELNERLRNTNLMWSNEVSTLDSNMNELNDLENELEKEKSRGDLLTLEDYCNSLRIKVNENDSHFENIHYDVTKEEFDQFVIFLKNTQKVLNTTYEFGKEPIREVVRLMKEKSSIPDFVMSNLLELESEKDRSQRTYLDTLIHRYQHVTIDCPNTCILKDLYKDVMKPTKASIHLDKVKRDAEFYQYMNLVYDNLSYVLSEFENYKDIILRLPTKLKVKFSLNNLYEHISNVENIYSDKEINLILSEITEYDNHQKAKEELKKTEEELIRLRDSSKIPFIETQITKLQNKISECKIKIDEYSSNEKTILKTIDEIQVLSQRLNNTLDARIKNDEIYNNLQDNISKEAKYKEIEKERSQVYTNMKHGNEQLLFMNETLNNKKNSLNEYIKLNKELSKYQEIFDELNLIRSAVSSKEGIPLLFIQMYLKNTKDVANELLDIVYEGSIYIEDFNISSSEFKIPFIKDGVEIPDICYASQGEQSFLSMAISFALSSQKLENYNIMLLDEVDGTFDPNNRERFISVLEHQIELIDSEQVFLISHNNMFDQYPVDILDLGNISNNTNIKVEVK